MALRVRAEFGDRFEAHLAAVPGGWISASSRALTRWTAVGPDEPLMVSEALPGPLAWLPRSGRIGWGPTVLADAEPRWPVGQLGRELLSDLGEQSARSFSLVTGAVSGEESEIFVVFGRAQSRVRGAPDHAETVRQAIVRPDGTVLEPLSGTRPTVVMWGDGDLAVGAPGLLRVRPKIGDWQHLDLGATTAPRSLARGPGDLIAAGTARGGVLIFDDGGNRRHSWSAHEAPVTAVCFASNVVVTGATDGLIRTWEGGRSTGELATNRPVVDLASVGDGRVVAVVGSSGDAVLLLDL
jgi:hypothetical protein